jgi:hypothetical protein
MQSVTNRSRYYKNGYVTIQGVDSYSYQNEGTALVVINDTEELLAGQSIGFAQVFAQGLVPVPYDESLKIAFVGSGTKKFMVRTIKIVQ